MLLLMIDYRARHLVVGLIKAADPYLAMACCCCRKLKAEKSFIEHDMLCCWPGQPRESRDGGGLLTKGAACLHNGGLRSVDKQAAAAAAISSPSGAAEKEKHWASLLFIQEPAKCAGPDAYRWQLLKKKKGLFFFFFSFFVLLLRR